MTQKRRKSRLGTITSINTTEMIENAIRERRERVIDLSRYNVGFEAVSDTKKRPPRTPSCTGDQHTKYLDKLNKGDLDKFSTKDLMYFFRDTANDNGVKFIIANPKIAMRQFKLAKEKGYSNQDLLAMIEFLFTSGQKYLDKHSLHPGILITNWCNTIYKDTQLWLEDKYNPNNTYNKNTSSREWKDNNEEVKSNVGEWE